MRKIFVIFALVMWASCSTAQAQGKQIRRISLEGYDQVLNLVFPVGGVNDFEAGKDAYKMVLRFMPSFRAESQIVIVEQNERVKITEYISLDGNISLKLDKMLKRMDEDPPKMAKKLRIKKRELTVPISKVRAWRASLMHSARKAIIEDEYEPDNPNTSVDVQADGTGYEFWDFSASGKLYYSPSGVQISNQKYENKRLFKLWMENIRKELVGSK